MSGASSKSEEQAAPSPGAGGRRRALLAFALLAMVALAYANAIFHPFVYDDTVLVLKNPEIRSVANIPELIGFGDDGLHLRKRWTRDVTYTLEYAVAGPSAPVYHATNIVLHGLAVLLVFGLIARVTRDPMIGWWTAALFAIHPIQTEVVAHVSGLRGLLAAIFSLAAVLLLLAYTRRGGIWRVALAMLAVFLGVFSKELAIMAPVAFVAIDLYTTWREKALLRSHLWRRKALYGCLAAFTLGLLYVQLFVAGKQIGVQGIQGFYDTWAGGLSFLDRASLVGLGLRLMLVPVGQSVDYSFDALGLMTGAGVPRMVMDLSILAAGLAAAGYGLARRNWVGLGGIWCLLFYLPHLGIIPWHEIFAERFLYLPSIGYCLAAATAGVALLRRPGAARMAGGLSLASFVILGMLTFATAARNEAWSSGEALWKSAVERYPDCARAHYSLANEYMKESRAALALEHYREALRILPPYADAEIGMAVAQTARREYPDALETLDRVLERWPTAPRALNTKAFIHETMGDLPLALQTYRRAVEAQPSFADGYNNMARLYIERGDVDTAIRMYETALEYNPALVAALENLAVVYREGLGDVERAEHYEERARRLTAIR